MPRMMVKTDAPGWRYRFHQVSGATLALIVTGTMARVITLLTQMVIAREFGISILSDAFFVAQNVPELFYEFLTAGFSMVFIPLFAKYRLTQGKEEAWKFASGFLYLSGLVSLVLAVITAAGSSFIVGLLAPGFEGSARQVADMLVRIMALSIIFLGLEAGLRGLLHSNREFIVPEIARLVFNCVLLGIAWSLSRRFGVLVLGWGVVLAAFIQLLIQGWGVVKQGGLNLTWAFDHPGVRNAARQLLPFIIAIAGVRIMFVLDRMTASGLSEGSIAALNYAGRIILLPVGLFALPLRTTLYPTISGFVAQSRLHDLADTTLSGLRILLFMVIPACVGLTTLRVPLTRLLFERGAFDNAATLTTSEALLYYAGGVPAIAAIFFLNNVFFSLGAPLTLIKLNIAGWGTNFVLNLVLSRYMGHQGIALATTVSATLTVVLMIVILKRIHLTSLNLRSLSSSVSKISVASAGMGFLLLMLPNTVNNILIQLQLGYQGLQAALLIVIGAATYLTISRLFKSDELRLLTSAFDKLLKRGL